MSSPPKVSFYVGCMNTINTLGHIMMGGALFLAVTLVDVETYQNLSAHAWVTIIGVTILCSQAIWSVTPYAGFEDNLYPRKSKIYWIIQIIGSVLILSGACIGISMVAHGIKNPNTIPIGIIGEPSHLMSSHGIVGFIALLLSAVTLVGAIANLLLGEKLQSFMKTLYAIVGTLTIVLAYIALSIRFGDYHRLLNVANNILETENYSTFGLGITFAVLSFAALLVMMCARVIVTGSIRF